MNKFIVVILAVIVLTGCTPNSIDQARQEYACREKGGAYEYVSRFYYLVECRNGEYVEWKNVVLSEDYYP